LATLHSRRNLPLPVPAVAAATLISQKLALAASPKAGTQVAGLCRTRFGDMEITAISDGCLPLGPDPAAVVQAIEASPQSNPMAAHVSASAVNTGSCLFIIEASGPTAQLPQSRGRSCSTRWPQTAPGSR
jgi:hypothetical protein